MLEPMLDIDDLLHHFLLAFMYGGLDCSRMWSVYLGDAQRPSYLKERLAEALGVTTEEVVAGKRKIEAGDWSCRAACGQ